MIKILLKKAFSSLSCLIIRISFKGSHRICRFINFLLSLFAFILLPNDVRKEFLLILFPSFVFVVKKRTIDFYSLDWFLDFDFYTRFGTIFIHNKISCLFHDQKFLHNHFFDEHFFLSIKVTIC